MGTTKTKRRGMIRAILAGGLVLGVGAAITLATWNDSEFATGNFASGSFNIQGATDDPESSPTWEDHATSDAAATVSFTVDAANLSPGDTVYAPFSMRVDPTKDSYDAEVVPGETPVATDGTLAPSLTTETYVSSYADCVSGSPGSTTFSTLTLAKDSTAQTLCLAVTMSEDADTTMQGQTGSATWQFDATSVTS